MEVEAERCYDSSRGVVKLIAAACGTSKDAIYNMNHADQPPYLTQVRRWTERALKELPRDRALTQVYYLVDHFLTPADFEDLSPARRTIAGGCADVMSELSDVVRAALDASQDNKVTASEYERFKKEKAELLRSVQLLDHQMDLRANGDAA